MSYLIRGARIVGPRSVEEGDILIAEGRIVRMGRLGRTRGVKIVNADGLYAIPGMIDLHVHGGAGFDATFGEFVPAENRFDASEEAYRRSLPRLMGRFARRGVTRAILATVAAPLEDLEGALSRLANYIESERNGLEGARLEGVLIEGTFIMRREHAGAQNPKNFLLPQRDIYERLDRAARGHIRYMNVAPEFGRPAERLIRHLVKRGVLVGMGHSGCGADQVRRCADLGLRVAIHFLNGPTGTSFKPFHGGNVKEAVLRSPDIYAEVICDGWHVAPHYVMDIVGRKGVHRVVAVTDAIFAAGMRGVRRFRLGGIEGVVHRSGRYVHVAGRPHLLFGSLLDMATAFANLLSWLTSDIEGVWRGLHRAIPFERALVRTARMCARNQARLLGIERTGVLRQGKVADIVLADIAGRPGEYRVRVRHTFVEGRKVV